MHGRLIFLVEEPSMKELLDHLLPRIFPNWVEGENFLCVKHSGKADLEKSIPKKLKAWREPNARFVVVRDNDGGNCVLLKNRLTELCLSCGKTNVLIRLVCQELESWYLGDLNALAHAYENASLLKNTVIKKYAHPDQIKKPSASLKQLLPNFQKIAGARLMAQHLSTTENCSDSFLVFVKGIQRIAKEMDYQS